MVSFDVERVLPWPAQALYELVADVDSYAQFMPGWSSARILRRDAGSAEVEQRVHLLGHDWHFRSRAEFDPPRRVAIRAGAPFRVFDLRWDFEPLSASVTRVRGALQAELGEPLLDELARHALPQLLQRTMLAFEQRAAQRIAPST